MKRRTLIAGAGASALALAACAREQASVSTGPSDQHFEWKMVTTWPPNFPGFGSGVNQLVKNIETASAGRLRIKIYAASELVPAFEVFDAVSRGTAEIGHGAAYYWKNKTPASQFFTAIPFGMNVMEMNGWMYYGGGLDLYRELYARPQFNLVPFPAGNTGVQMGGWFNKPINSLADLQGLKMRIPGIGGEVLKRAGGTPVTLPASEIFTALQTGSIDAAEWVGPYNDMALGLQDAARYYYYPGWQEPGPLLECIVNQDAWAGLPPDLRAIVELACGTLNDQMMAEFFARNADSLARLEQNADVEIRPFPNDVLHELRRYTGEVLADMVAKNPDVAKVYESFAAYRARAARWSAISEHAYLNTRNL
ncbi:MAG: TRAP transporter substrate-binding protein [Pseudomonadota bacterium]|nr:TRAP transporter substrate-binding protein [Pseudomonadota bacterium]